MKHLSKLSPNRLSFAHVALAYQEYSANPYLLKESPIERQLRHKICTELIGSIVSGACASSLQVT